MIRVFLVDDHEIVRRGIADLIDAERDLEVVGESGTVRGTLAKIELTNPHVVVLDVRLPDGDGIELCRAVRSARPDIRCIMLTAYDDDEASRSAVLAGASGYVLKDIRARGLVEGVRKVAAGGTLLSTRVSESVAKSFTASYPEDTDLTMRERQVLDLITEGLTNRQIGERLGLAEKTVKNYVSGLLAKLGMERRTQAAVYGLEHRR